MGDITGDLSSRRGRVMSTDALPGSRLSIRGQVPLAEMGDYQSRVKSMTGGEGHYTMEFADYEPDAGRGSETPDRGLSATGRRVKAKPSW